MLITQFVYVQIIMLLLKIEVEPEDEDGKFITRYQFLTTVENQNDIHLVLLTESALTLHDFTLSVSKLSDRQSMRSTLLLLG